MPHVEFGHTTPVSEQAKTVHALDRAATVIANCVCTMFYIRDTRNHG
jgi:hypothetical protein